MGNLRFDGSSSDFSNPSSNPSTNSSVSLEPQLLQLISNLDTKQVAELALALAYQITEKKGQAVILLYDSSKENYSVLQAQADNLVQPSLELAQALRQHNFVTPHFFPEINRDLPFEIAAFLPEMKKGGLFSIPLEATAPLNSQQEIGLLLVYYTGYLADNKTIETFGKLTRLGQHLAVGLNNARRYRDIATEYAKLQALQRTWQQLWFAVEDQQKAIERLLARNQALHDIGLAINSSLDLEEVLARIVNETVKLMNVRRGAIVLWGEKGHDIRILAEHTTDSEPNKPSFAQLSVSKGYSDELKQAAEDLPAFNLPTEISQEISFPLRHLLADYWNVKSTDRSSTLVTSVRWQKQMLGAIILNDPTPERTFTQEDHDLLTLLAGQAAVAIENARLFKAATDERNRTSAILYSIADGVFTTDLELKITSLNPAAATITGHDANAVNGHLYTEALDMTDRDGKRIVLETSPCYQAITNKTATEPGIFQIKQANGKSMLIALVAAPISDSNSGISGVVGVFRDVTREQEVARLKDEFVSLVSHELRTPMASVLGFSELILTRKLSESKLNLYVETIYKEAQRLSNLINDFLDIQRMESGRQIYNYTEIDFKLLLRAVLDLFASQRERFIVNVPENLPPLWSDPDRILQALTNLVGNALKYSPNGREVIIKAHSNPGNMVEISVQDFGLGIPKEAQAQLFTKFYRVDNSDRREIGGTGLGLAISREIIEAHGGRIWVDSDLGKGSIFYFTLPVKRAETVELEVPTSNSKILPELIGTQTILIVEDNPSLGSLIGTHLEEGGFQYELVGSAEEAVALLERSDNPPAMIVLDIMLAGAMDGWDFLIYLKNKLEFSHIPVIICTVQDNKNGSSYFGEAEFLTKPVDVRRLLDAVNRVTPQRPQRQVLIIDDDANLRRMFKEVLTAQDFVVATAASGEQGIKLATQNQPDVIVLDLMMPKMDGFQVLAQLRSRRQTITIPVVVVSAKELTPAERDFLHNGLAIFLTKTEYTPQRVRQIVEQTIGSQKNV